MVFNEVKVLVCKIFDVFVFMYLCNVFMLLMKEFGYGDGYCYVYNELNVFVVGEIYFLESFIGICLYNFNECGLEKVLKVKCEFFDLFNVRSNNKR